MSANREDPLSYLEPFWPFLETCFEEAEGLAEALQEAIGVWHAQRTVSATNVTIREVPPMLDVATQTEVDTITRAIQTIRMAGTDAATEMDAPSTWDVGTCTAEDAPYDVPIGEAYERYPLLAWRTPAYTEEVVRHTYAPVEGIPAPSDERVMRCFNCTKPGHHYNRCPEPMVVPICFRCGRRGITVRECPRCGDGWAAQGPYRPSLGRHINPSPYDRPRYA